MACGEDIIIQILSRLPVRSLLRLKCVCKEWRLLIESHVFISNHCNRETNRSCLLVQYVPPEGEISRFALFPDKDLKGTPPANEDLHEQLSVGRIFGPVNGLFFVHRDFHDPDCLGNPMAIWNLATRQLKRIIYPKPTMPSHCSLVIQQLGFGFDCSSNDYKVIWFRFYYNDETNHLFGDPDVTIYSPSKDSWSSPVEMICQPYDSLGNTFTNGAYYWLSWHTTDRLTHCHSIPSFDMASEVFRDIQGPDNLDHLLGPNSLVLYNDHLGLLISEYCSLDQVPSTDYCSLGPVFHPIWIMEEEGCWIKLLTIGPYPDRGAAVGIWKNNESDPR